eukprot:scaffold172165_cov15-Tisochrysis_lutea.AAC.1
MFRPPALPSITEISRPELKLADGDLRRGAVLLQQCWAKAPLLICFHLLLPSGLRIDPDLFARSKMGYSTGLAILPSDQVVPAAPDNKYIKHIRGLSTASLRRPCHLRHQAQSCIIKHPFNAIAHPSSFHLGLVGYPEGSCLNYAMWSPNGKHVSFTTRSPGVGSGLIHNDAVMTENATLLFFLPPNSALSTAASTCSYTFLDDDNIVACVLPKGVSAETAPKRPTLGPQGPRISVSQC